MSTIGKAPRTLEQILDDIRRRANGELVDYVSSRRPEANGQCPRCSGRGSKDYWHPAFVCVSCGGDGKDHRRKPQPPAGAPQPPKPHNEPDAGEDQDE